MKKIFFGSIVLTFLFANISFAQISCGDYNWTKWTAPGSSTTSVNATILCDGVTHSMTVNTNYPFDFTPSIFSYGTFSGFTKVLPPNTTCMRTTFLTSSSAIMTSTTSFCFGSPVTNPVILLSSIGQTGLPVPLTFSSNFNVIYNGGGLSAISSNSLIGREGYCILEFPGTHSCISVTSNTYEFYCNVTVGIKNQTTHSVVTTPSCAKENTGTAKIQIRGSANNFTYSIIAPKVIGPQTDSVFKGLAPGTYTYSIQNKVPCIYTGTFAITGSSPAPTLITSAAPSIICDGNSSNLNVSGADTYTWSNGSISSSLTVTPPSTTIYTVEGTNSLGCKNTATVAVNIIIPKVLITPLPTICNNATINLLASNGGTAYVWAGPNGFSSSLQNPSITPAKLKHSGLYSVKATNIYGCVGLATINVYVYDSLKLKDISPNVTLCAGKTATLSTNGGIGGSGYYDFIWSPTIYLASPNLAVTGTTAHATTIYSLTLSDIHCPMTTPRTLTVEVKVNPLPVITYSTSSPRGCEPFTTHFEASSKPNGSNVSWSFNNDLSSINFKETAFTFPTRGIYNMKLTITDINGCVDSVSEKSFIIVDPKPFADFSYMPFEPTTFENDVNFTDHSSVGLPMQKWHWIFGDSYSTAQNDNSTKQNPNHVYENSGTFPVTLEVTNVFGCKETNTKMVKIADDFAIFIPNAFSPSKKDGKNDTFTAQGNGFMKESFEMTIYDRWGEEVYKTNDIHKGWDGTVKNGATAKSDVYIYKINLRDLKNNPKEYTGHVTLL